MVIAYATPAWRAALTAAGLEVESHFGSPLVELNERLIGDWVPNRPIFLGLDEPGRFEKEWLRQALSQCTVTGRWGAGIFSAEQQLPDRLGAVLLHPAFFGDRQAFDPWFEPQGLTDLCRRQGRHGTLVVGAVETRAPKTTPQILWQGPLFDPSGYATEGRGLVRWFPRPLALRPVVWSPNRIRLDGSTQRQLAARVTEIEPTITIQHGFPTHFQRVEGRVIGRTMYESSRLPEAWIEALDRVDELWVPSVYCGDLFGAHHPRVKVVPSPIDVDVFRPTGNSLGSLKTQRRCRFLFFAEWIERKNWRLTLEALAAAFTDEPVELVVKTHSTLGVQPEVIKAALRAALPKPFPITYVNGLLTEPELANLYNSCHCLIHFAHAEGFGRTVAEMYACGGEVLSHAQTGLADVQPFGLPATWVPIPETAKAELPQIQEAGHEWLDIELEVAVEALRASYQRWLAGTLQSARSHIVRNFSGPAVARVIEGALP
jgi:glycosyltransferase involved in cell wall biosynthesis